jgi:imidazolonepropionase-like amidohydrolase
MTYVRFALVVLAACGAPRSAVTAPAGRTSDGRDVAVSFYNGEIVSMRPADATTWLWPPIVDSHVHLALEPVGAKLAANGVEVAVDLAEPETALAAIHPGNLHVLASGPMLTHANGYPLDAWGAGGYGIGCADAACVRATIDRLVGKGVRVIKIALDDDGLDPALVPVVVDEASAKHVKVAAHALTDIGARIAGRAGVDILAHTPVEPLADDTIEAWRGRTVISTLAAFGGRDDAVENLRKLRAAGVTVLYGTDLGNTHEAGPNRAEIELLRKAGLDDAAITAAMTTVPLAYWGFDLAFAPGKEGTFLVLDGDPRKDVTTLLHPIEVWLHAKRM